MALKMLAAAVTVALIAGCNSSSSGSGSGGSSGDQTFTVIDGYIQNGIVCARETLQDTCVFSTTTNNEGKFTLPSEYADYIITTDIVGGVSSDSDTIGLSPRSYSMQASEGEAVITPFSTIAAMNDGISLEDIAAELELSIDELTSDYVANSNAKTHLFARTIASQLEFQPDSDNSATLLAVAQETKALVEKMEGENPDIDFNAVTINVKVNGDSVEVEDAPRVSALEDVLEIKDELGDPLPVYMASLNSAYLADEGVFSVKFNDGLAEADDAPGEYMDYIINGDKLILVDDNEVDQYLYISQEISLAVPLDDNDLGVVSPKDFTDTKGRFTKAELVGNTFYYIMDDSNSFNPEPIYSAMAFGEDYVTITEEIDGEMVTNEPVEYNVNILTGVLNIKTSQWGEGERDMSFEKALESTHILVTKRTDREKYGLFFYDKHFSEKIYADWLGTQD